MQVKLCPKCGMENKPDKASCSGCYSSLESVTPTEGKERPAPVRSQSTAQQPPAAPSAAPGIPGVPTEAPRPNYGPPPGAPNTYGPSFRDRPAAPVKRGPNWGAIVLVILLLGGGGFAGWWFFMKPATPDQVVLRFMDATKAGDFDKMKACLTASMVSKIQMTPGGEDAARKSFQAKATQGQGNNPFEGKITGVTYDDKNSSSAYVTVEPASMAQMPPGITNVEMVCSKEGGQWKLDLEATMMRMMKRMFSKGMPGARRPGM